MRTYGPTLLNASLLDQALAPAMGLALAQERHSTEQTRAYLTDTYVVFFGLEPSAHKRLSNWIAFRRNNIFHQAGGTPFPDDSDTLGCVKHMMFAYSIGDEPERHDSDDDRPAIKFPSSNGAERVIAMDICETLVLRGVKCQLVIHPLD
jgi:hypothetical protein